MNEVIVEPIEQESVSTKVLVCGGLSKANAPSRIYSVSDKLLSWKDGPQMAIPRYCHGTQNIGGGNVFVSGGLDSCTCNNEAIECEVYLAATNEFKRLGCKLSVPRIRQAMARLPNGNVIMMGGAWKDGTVYRTCEIFDPVRGCVFASNALHSDNVTGAAACTLRDGSVLFTGGCANKPSNPPEKSYVSSGTRLYDYREDKFHYGRSMIYGRCHHTITSVEDGAIVLGGDVNCSTDKSSTIEKYDNRTGDFVSLGQVSCGLALTGHFAVRVGGVEGLRSRVLFGGGIPGDGVTTIRLFDMQERSLITQENALDNRRYATANVI